MKCIRKLPNDLADLPISMLHNPRFVIDWDDKVDVIFRFFRGHLRMNSTTPVVLAELVRDAIHAYPQEWIVYASLRP
jgi:hypothetical protein